MFCPTTFPSDTLWEYVLSPYPSEGLKEQGHSALGALTQVLLDLLIVQGDIWCRLTLLQSVAMAVIDNTTSSQKSVCNYVNLIIIISKIDKAPYIWDQPTHRHAQNLHAIKNDKYIIL